MENIPLSDIIVDKEFNARKEYKVVEMLQLKRSIESEGLLQPVVVDQNNNLIAGFRRYLAFQELGYLTIPAKVVRIDSKEDAFLINITENLIRTNLTLEEEINAIKYLETYLTPAQIARKINKSPSWVACRMKISELPSDVLEAINNSRITIEEALALDKRANNKATSILDEMFLYLEDKRKGVHQIKIKPPTEKTNFSNPSIMEIKDMLDRAVIELPDTTSPVIRTLQWAFGTLSDEQMISTIRMEKLNYE